MLCYASIADDTYEPYLPTNTETAEKAFSDVSWSEQNVLGAKNLFNARSFTRDTLTVTKEADGGYLISGTATVAARYIPDVAYFNLDMPPIKKGRYKFIAVDADGNSVFRNRFAYQAFGRNSTADAWVEFSKNGNVFTVPDDYAITWVRLNMAENVAYDTKVYIMVMPATIEDETFAPYAMSNRELTEMVSHLPSAMQAVDGFDFDDATIISNLYKKPYDSVHIPFFNTAVNQPDNKHRYGRN